MEINGYKILKVMRVIEGVKTYKCSKDGEEFAMTEAEMQEIQPIEYEEPKIEEKKKPNKLKGLVNIAHGVSKKKEKKSKK